MTVRQWLLHNLPSQLAVPLPRQFRASWHISLSCALLCCAFAVLQASQLLTPWHSVPSATWLVWALCWASAAQVPYEQQTSVHQLATVPLVFWQQFQQRQLDIAGNSLACC